MFNLEQIHTTPVEIGVFFGVGWVRKKNVLKRGRVLLSDMIPLLPNKLPFFRQFHIIFGFIEKCQIYSICYFKMMSAETKWVTLTIHNRFVCCCFQLCNGQLRQRRLPRLTRKSKVFKTGLPKWIFDINKSLYKSK